MFVCLCHGVTQSQLETFIERGNTTFCDVMNDIPIAGKCKKCVPAIVKVIKEKNKNDLIYTEIK